jgi:hypothetical protein
VSVLKSLFDNLTLMSVEDLFMVDVGETLAMLAQFISRYNAEPAAARARLKFCSLVESANKRAERLALIRRDMCSNSSSDVLDIISEWIADPVTVCP